MFPLGQLPENTLGGEGALKPLLLPLQERASAWHKEADLNQGISHKGK